MWWDDVGGELYLWYDDGNSQQWVIANSSPPGPQGPNWQVGPGLHLNTGTSPSTIDVATPYLALSGSTAAVPVTGVIQFGSVYTNTPPVVNRIDLFGGSVGNFGIGLSGGSLDIIGQAVSIWTTTGRAGYFTTVGLLVSGANFNNGATFAALSTPANNTYYWDITTASLQDARAMAQGVGGGITFQGQYTTAGAYADFAGVEGRKANATTGDPTGNLILWARSGTINFFVGNGQIGNGQAASLSSTGLSVVNGWITAGNLITSNGTNAGFDFQDRGNSALSWIWYATGGIARLYNGSDVLTVSSGGNLTVAGSYYSNGVQMMYADSTYNYFYNRAGGASLILFSGNNTYRNTSHHFDDGSNTFLTMANGNQTVFYSHHWAINDNTWICGNTGNAWTYCVAYNHLTSSDAKHKTDLDDLPDCLSFVRELKPQTYRLNNGPEEGRRVRRWGFVAQHVKAVIGGGDDFGGHHESNDEQALDYAQLTAVLWKAVQEMAARIDQLEARLA
jgi:hypothetical protein